MADTTEPRLGDICEQAPSFLLTGMDNDAFSKHTEYGNYIVLKARYDSDDATKQQIDELIDYQMVSVIPTVRMKGMLETIRGLEQFFIENDLRDDYDAFLVANRLEDQ